MPCLLLLPLAHKACPFGAGRLVSPLRVAPSHRLVAPRLLPLQASGRLRHRLQKTRAACMRRACACVCRVHAARACVCRVQCIPRARSVNAAWMQRGCSVDAAWMQ
eukprot:scaffold84498_cov75-Phaeocystis_antarctica.AAC.3